MRNQQYFLVFCISLGSEAIRITHKPYDQTQPNFSTHRNLLANLVEPTSPENHRVNSLPGQPAEFTQKQYAGGLPVDDASNGYLFYWLFECSSSPSTKPLVIWMNG